MCGNWVRLRRIVVAVAVPVIVDYCPRVALRSLLSMLSVMAMCWW